jgi:hypothetical protein
MGVMKSMWMDECAEVESAVYEVLREAKYLSCASPSTLAGSGEWLEEARELLNDAIAKAARAEHESAY